MTARSLPEWIGRTPDTPAPPRVRLRRFEFYGGICQLTGRKIGPADKWQLDHIVAIINGGQNRESNLWPVLTSAHKAKTRADVAEKSKVAAIRKRHLGIKPKPTFRRPPKSVAVPDGKAKRIAAKHAAHLAKMKAKGAK